MLQECVHGTRAKPKTYRVHTDVDINNTEKQNSILSPILKFLKTLKERQMQCWHGMRTSAGRVCRPLWARAATCSVSMERSGTSPSLLSREKEKRKVLSQKDSFFFGSIALNLGPKERLLILRSFLPLLFGITGFDPCHSNLTPVPILVWLLQL